jgi:hypothetical protein
MAVWQFDFIVVPRGRLPARAIIEGRVLFDDIEITDWWVGVDIPNTFENSLDSMLPRLPSSIAGVTMWGDEEGNRIDVIREGGRITEIRIRLDARHPDPTLLEQLTLCVQSIQGVLISEEGEIVEPTPRTLLRELSNSSAHRFVIDPKAFLRNLHDPDSLPPGLTSRDDE